MTIIFKIIVLLPAFAFFIFTSECEGRRLLKKRNLSKKEENYIFYLQLYVMISLVIIGGLLSIIP